MKYILFFSILFVSQVRGQQPGIRFYSDTSLNYAYMLHPFKNYGFYDITNDKWIINDTMEVIKYLYNQIQFHNQVDEWYEKRIYEIYKIFPIISDLLEGKDITAGARFKKQWAKIHSIERKRPKNTNQ